MLQGITIADIKAAQPSLITDSAKFRVSSIDLLRGLVMIIMAIDHVRDFFHYDSFVFDPLDLEKTNVGLFFTRWITHFCAPVFVFLAGTAAFLSGQRKSKKELSWFLLTRGVWLVFLEISIVGFGWGFNIRYPFTGLAVIFALGVCMIALAAIIHLRFKVILALGLLIVFGHNLLDNVHFDSFWWAVIHETRVFRIDENHLIRTAYPVLAWIGIMALGYCFGKLYAKNIAQSVRKKWLLILGSSAILLFIILRFSNVYGDQNLWSNQASWQMTLLSFLNTTKYPPSLLFTLMTLGPAMIFLAFTENAWNKMTKPIITIGRVPMFYYLLHLYLIHLLAMIGAEVSGFSWRDMIFERRAWVDLKGAGYGFPLWVTYAVWVLVVLMLYPLCKWYDRYKTAHKDNKWLSYL